MAVSAQGRRQWCTTLKEESEYELHQNLQIEYCAMSNDY